MARMFGDSERLRDGDNRYRWHGGALGRPWRSILNIETKRRMDMPARRFNEGDIDFEAIDADLAKLVAPKLGL